MFFNVFTKFGTIAASPKAQTFEKPLTCKKSFVTILPYLSGKEDFFTKFEAAEPIVEINVLVSIIFPLLKIALYFETSFNAVFK